MSEDLGTADVIAFVATDQPGKALAFYRDVLGLSLIADEEYAIVFDANGTMLRIQKVREHSPLPGTSLGWKVVDVHRTVAALAARGVRFERYEGLSQDADGVWTTPAGAKVAWLKDPDGNVLSLTQL